MPGVNATHAGAAAGTMPRSPAAGRGLEWLPQRPDEEGGGNRIGMIVGVVVASVVVLLGLCSFLVLSLTGAFNGLGSLGASPTATVRPVIVQVPRFKGMTLTDAKTVALQDKITLTTTYATPDPNDSNPPPKDQVLDQSPEPGQHTGAVPTVALIISAGPGQTVVPNIVGKDDATACVLLQQAKLTCYLQGYEQSTQPAGTVTRTDPPGGTSVDPHTSVSYWLSQGPPTPTATISPTPTSAATATATATATCTATPTGPTATPGGPPPC